MTTRIASIELCRSRCQHAASTSGPGLPNPSVATSCPYGRRERAGRLGRGAGAEGLGRRLTAATSANRRARRGSWSRPIWRLRSPASTRPSRRRSTARWMPRSRGYPYAKGAVEMAAYDLAGRTLGVPVHRLLGGMLRDAVCRSPIRLGCCPSTRRSTNAKSSPPKASGRSRSRSASIPNGTSRSCAGSARRWGLRRRSASTPIAATARLTRP